MNGVFDRVIKSHIEDYLYAGGNPSHVLEYLSMFMKRYGNPKWIQAIAEIESCIVKISNITGNN